MNYRSLVCLLCLVAIVGIVSADTIIFYAENDGHTRRVSNQAFSILRNSSGTAVTNNPAVVIARLKSSSITNQYSDIYRPGFTFNLTNYNFTTNATSAKIGLYGYDKLNGLGGTFNVSIVTFEPTDKSAFASGDYALAKWGATPLANTIEYSSLDIESYNNFTLSNLSSITYEGVTTFGMRFGWDTYNNFSGTWSSLNISQFSVYGQATAGLLKDPFLEITYNPAGTSPVASFACTKNFIRIPNTIACTDTSTNTPTSWSWNMGDGTAALTTKNVTYTYYKRGSWGITLNATNAGGSNTTPTATNVRVTGYENYW